MSSRISSKKSLYFVMAVMAALLMPRASFAQLDTKEIRNAIDTAGERSVSSEDAMINGKGGLKTDLKEGLESIIRAADDVEKERDKEESKSSPIPGLRDTYAALPLSFITMDQLDKALMFNRLRELNRVSLGDKGADYMVDTFKSADVDVQYFDIFMRYFCDPEARAGGLENDKMGDKKFKMLNVKRGGKTLSYDVGCGTASNEAVPSRQSVLGDKEMNTSPEASQIISLPLRPDVMFFNASTFPTLPAKNAPAGDKQTNVNRLANVYYGAFALSMRFLLGAPPKAYTPGDGANDKSAYIEAKAQIARQSLASVPFIELFTAQTGTMGPQAAQATASLLREKLGPAIADENIYNRVKNIERRNTISLAEYMDIIMYQLMLSPKYYERINSELNPTELRREAVWLAGMQTALNYQRNRWLEILAALEAVH